MDRFDRRDRAVRRRLPARHRAPARRVDRGALPARVPRGLDRVPRQPRRRRARSAETFLAERGRSLAGARFAGRFGVDEEPKVYLERELGLEKAGGLYGPTAKVWRWEMRWFRSGVKEEERVSITPLGDLVGFESVRRDDAPGPRPRGGEARAIALAFLAVARPAGDRLQATSRPRRRSRPNRTDWTFVDEKAGSPDGGGDRALRDDRLGRRGHGVSASSCTSPRPGSATTRRLRSKNKTAGAVGDVGLFVTFLAMIVVLVTQDRAQGRPLAARRGASGSSAFVLSLLSTFNGIPLTLYETTTRRARSRAS